MTHLFISYASADQAIALEVCALLEARGVSCWIAPRDVTAGKVWDEAILDAIEGASAFLLVLSSHANESAFVKNEVNRAFSLNKPIITFRINDVVPGRSLELYLARHHWTDGFGGDLEQQVDELATSITTLAGLGSASDVVTRAPAKIASKSTSRGTLRMRERVAWGVAAAAIITVAALAVPAARWLRGSPPETREMRLNLVIPTRQVSFALSPDGRTVVFEFFQGGTNKLWIRPIDADVSRPLAGTETTGGSILPFWSPDSRSIGFFSDSKLKRLDLVTSSVRTIADLPGWEGGGGTWNRAGVIVFALSGDGAPLYRVSADGGTPSPLTRLASDERVQRYPQFLPDGRHFILFSRTTTNHGIYVGSLDSPDTRRILDADGKAVVVPPDAIVFARNGSLLAQHFDFTSMTPQGSPVPVGSDVAEEIASRNTSASANIAITASDTGLLMFRSGTARASAMLRDASGRDLGTVSDAVAQGVLPPAFSPDGRTIALPLVAAGNVDLWLFDTDRKTPPRRFTSDPAADGFPVWSPDGKQIAFGSNRTGVWDIYVQSVDGNDEHVLLKSSMGKVPNSWSADGRFLLYQQAGPATADDEWALPLFGDRTPIPVAQTRFLECCGSFSPDGRWVSYDSFETGRRELYIQPFPGTTGRIRVSGDGGGNEAWRADGRMIFYVDGANHTMRVPVTTEGGALRLGRAEQLFPDGAVASRDGRTFLQNIFPDTPMPLTVLMNWSAHAPAGQ